MLHCSEQSRAPGARGTLQGSSMLQQQSGHVAVPLLRDHMQSCLPRSQCGIDIADLLFQQQASDVKKAALASYQERRSFPPQLLRCGRCSLPTISRPLRCGWLSLRCFDPEARSHKDLHHGQQACVASCQQGASRGNSRKILRAHCFRNGLQDFHTIGSTFASSLGQRLQRGHTSGARHRRAGATSNQQAKRVHITIPRSVVESSVTCLVHCHVDLGSSLE
mmetsp:Transcript_35609/g.93105  ORF Transcript_35609/g.93105 Transcript_35609/m.93105 type:complete len:221 (-) Transcript_35609:469-1131(-)